MERDEEERVIIEKIERFGEIIDEEPVFNKTIREIVGLKHVRVSIGPYFCPACGQRISKDNVSRCSTCGKLQCQDCATSHTYSKEIHCRDCLKNDHDIFLTKQEYLILLCATNDVTDERIIFRLTGMKPDAVNNRIRELTDRYLTKKPSSLKEKLFPKLRLTDHGRDALGVFEDIYGNDPDSLAAKQRILEFRSEKEREENLYRLNVEDSTCQPRDC